MSISHIWAYMKIRLSLWFTSGSNVIVTVSLFHTSLLLESFGHA